MKRAELGAIVRYSGVLYEVIGIGEGKHYILRTLDRTTCPECGRPKEDMHLLEHSMNFQQGAEPVVTLEVD